MFSSLLEDSTVDWTKDLKGFEIQGEPLVNRTRQTLLSLARLKTKMQQCCTPSIIYNS